MTLLLLVVVMVVVVARVLRLLLLLLLLLCWLDSVISGLRMVRVIIGLRRGGGGHDPVVVVVVDSARPLRMKEVRGLVMMSRTAGIAAALGLGCCCCG